MDYLPRYTPIVRALMASEPLTVGDIAAAAGISQPAATQTVALMIRKGIVSASRGSNDARQRMIRLTRRGRALISKLEACWDATARAHADLDAELGFPLSAYLDRAIVSLKKKSFLERMS
ncbi:MAG: MarR family transcriptional regulator [Candidatus Aquilonibacter sp.]